MTIHQSCTCKGFGFTDSINVNVNIRILFLMCVKRYEQINFQSLILSCTKLIIKTSTCFNVLTFVAKWWYKNVLTIQ